MRTCEGGGENPFCYHRVATLAMRRKEHRAWHYVPIAIAPAALMATLGIACASHHESEPLYGVSCPENGCGVTEAGTDRDAVDLPDSTFVYGDWTPPDDPQPDAGADAQDAEAQDAAADGADVDLDVVDKYGVPAPDGAVDAEPDAPQD